MNSNSTTNPQSSILTHISQTIQQLDDYLNYEFPDLLLERGLIPQDPLQNTTGKSGGEELLEGLNKDTSKVVSTLQRVHKSIEEQSVSSYIGYILDLSEATLDVIIHACILL